MLSGTVSSATDIYKHVAYMYKLFKFYLLVANDDLIFV